MLINTCFQSPAHKTFAINMLMDSFKQKRISFFPSTFFLIQYLHSTYPQCNQYNVNKFLSTEFIQHQMKLDFICKCFNLSHLFLCFFKFFQLHSIIKYPSWADRQSIVCISIDLSTRFFHQSRIDTMFCSCNTRSFYTKKKTRFTWCNTRHPHNTNVIIIFCRHQYMMMRWQSTWTK